MLAQYQANASQGKSWSTVRSGETISLFVCYKKGGVAVIGVYTLPELGGQIERSTGIKAQVCMVQNGDVLNGKKQAEQIRLLSKIMAEEIDAGRDKAGFIRCLAEKSLIWILDLYHLFHKTVADRHDPAAFASFAYAVFCRGSVPAFPVYEKAGGTAASTVDGCHEPHSEW